MAPNTDTSIRYTLRDGERLAFGLRRIARSDVEAAVTSLRDSGDVHEGVHEARKRLKRVRAVLRLLREDIGDERFASENVFFRDCGRELAEVRDAQVSVETLDALLAHLALGQGEFDGLHRQLVERFEDISARHLSEDRRHERVAAALEGSAGRIDFWPIGEDRFETIAPGLRRVYREGRKRRDEAYDDPSFERFHEWRKQVKYLAAQVSILEAMVPRLLRPVSESLDRISDLVGESTDLAELALLLQDDEGPVMEEPRRRALLELIEARRAELRALAHPLAEFAWRDEPDRFVERLSTCWEAWRREIPARDDGPRGLEIERKFLVLGDPRGPSTVIRQGYLALDDPEVRIRLGGDGAWLTVKTVANPANDGAAVESPALSSHEIEIPVAAEEAERLYEACRWKLRKTRYFNGRWEVDAFDEPRRFLVAEVELSATDEPLPTPPAWLRIVREVTEDPRYENRNLARTGTHPNADGDPREGESAPDPFDFLERVFSDAERVLFGSRRVSRASSQET